MATTFPHGGAAGVWVNAVNVDKTKVVDLVSTVENAVNGAENAIDPLSNGARLYTASGSAGNFSITSQTPISAYAEGMEYEFVSNHDITGPATLSVDGLTATSIQRYNPTISPLVADDIINGQIVRVKYSGGVWVATLDIDAGGGSVSTVVSDYVQGREWAWSNEVVPTAGAASVSFTGIPDGVNEIAVHINGAAISTNRIATRLGTAIDGTVAAGYQGLSGAVFGNATSGAVFSTGFVAFTFTAGSGTTATQRIVRMGPGQKWCASGTHGRTSSGGDFGSMTGQVVLPNTLDRVVFESSGSGTFSAGGTIQIGWRY